MVERNMGRAGDKIAPCHPLIFFSANFIIFALGASSTARLFAQTAADYRSLGKETVIIGQLGVALGTVVPVDATVVAGRSLGRKDLESECPVWQDRSFGFGTHLIVLRIVEEPGRPNPQGGANGRQPFGSKAGLGLGRR
jgi:hypothetical protein